jgi:hypothetical protein
MYILTKFSVMLDSLGQAARVSHNKASLYTSVCAALDIRFVPLAQETFGGSYGMESHQILLISERQADRTGAARGLSRNALVRALSVATQRSIGRDIIDRVCRLPKHSPLLPPFPS